MKVLHTEWSDGWGGQEIRIINEMLAMQGLGVEVFLACKAQSKIYQEAKKNNLQFFILPFRGNADLSTIFQLYKIIKKYNIDIINTHSGKDTWVGGIAAKLTRIKFIRTRHLSNPINKSRLNFINELADFVITTGEIVRRDMIHNNRISPEKIMSIPTGPSEKIFNPNIYKYENCRDIFNLTKDEIVIGMLAVLRRFKRHDRFLVMAKHIRDNFPQKKFKFLIAGDGPQRENIELLIQQNDLKKEVILLGHIKNQAEFLCAIDLFVMVSDSGEGVPQSLIQALMMNKKSISTNVGSVSDLFDDNNFQLIRNNSQKALNLSVKNFLLSDSNNSSSKVKCNDFVKVNFSEKVMADKILKIYKQLLNNENLSY